MTELGQSERRKKMKVREAQAAMSAMLPEIEALAARYLEISKQLEAREPTDEFVFGRPGRDSLRYFTSVRAAMAAEQLRDVVDYAREGAQRTHADLLTRWEGEQRRDAEREPDSWSLGRIL